MNRRLPTLYPESYRRDKSSMSDLLIPEEFLQA